MISIGSTLWMFDESRRVYPKETFKKGQIWPRGKPIWREHWRPMQIIGETRVSWLAAEDPGAYKWAQYKLPKSAFKNGACPRGWALSEEHLMDLEWAEENRHKLSERVARCYDPKILQAVMYALEGEK